MIVQAMERLWTVCENRGKHFGVRISHLIDICLARGKMIVMMMVMGGGRLEFVGNY